MIISYASNAVLSKARAMYGKRISEKNYEELISCKNISEVANYLKKKTIYSDVLKDIGETDIHRSEIEDRLRLKLFMDFEKLGRYDLSVGERFCDYFISRAQVEQFIRTIMLLAAGRPGKHSFPVPDFFQKHTNVDLGSLPSCTTYDDFLKCIKQSHYYDMLFPFKPKDDKPINVTAIETLLRNYLYDVIFDIINKHVKGEAKKQLNDFFKLYIDLNNMVKITRMKKFYKLSDEYMLSCIIKGGNLSMAKLRSFVETPSSKQMMVDMKNTPMGKKWFSRNLDIIDMVPRNMRYNWCKHNIRFSVSPQVVLLSYIFLEENEILNIISIIEGFKYRLSASEIKKMLII